MIPPTILEKLQEIEPEASFTGALPRVKSSSDATYYAKLGAPNDRMQYAGEAESLKLLGEAAPSLVPSLLLFEVNESGSSIFISEYKDISPLSSQAADVLARRLATEMHTKTSPAGFGFAIPTYCGITKLNNGWFERWDVCYGSMIGDLLGQLQSKNRYSELCKKGAMIQEQVIPQLLGSLDIKPVILHGDLWSGNVGVDKATGQPIIYDPASYFGYNEADLALARIFDGFSDSFFATYHRFLPKSEPVHQYNLRMDLYELFHYLNHTLIFGGNYAAEANKKMDRLLVALNGD